MSTQNRSFSSQVVDGDDRAPSRSMLRAVGFEDDDFKKAQIGVASTWSMVTPVICTLMDSLEKLKKVSIMQWKRCNF